ncbi:MAG: methionine adenosyltransferase [Clostridiaceae bacterium]|nr:methionine adenosyltransferase [Clostridiaceae bacterium]
MSDINLNSPRVYTSESVTEGHPDKVCDQISDAILDAILAQDPMGRVACETVVTTGMVLVFGEITTECYVDVPTIVRRVLTDIGYTRSVYGFEAETCAILQAIDEQSPDIAGGVNFAWEKRGVRKGLEPGRAIVVDKSQTGAGDQGMMYGYACTETEELMPLPIALANRLAARLAKVRKDSVLPFLRPDGKTMVTISYEGHRPVHIDTILISAQHDPDVTLEEIQDGITAQVIVPTVPENLFDDNTRILVNTSGRFVVGGPQGDSGLTGRKLIVDTYGGRIPHGGGAFSGKDPTKADRSGSYGARYVAKNLVAAGLATTCEVNIAYAIGMAEPLAVMVDSKGTGILPDARLSELARSVFDLTPDGIIDGLDLRRPIYRPTAAYGAFGRPELDLPWERLDRVAELRNRAGLA